jgi:ribonuclease PH
LLMVYCATCFCCSVLDTHIISRAAGSAYIELGDTKVMAAV